MRCKEALSILVLAVMATGCSSTLKEYNPKMGLLDRLAQMEPANHLGDRARDEDQEERVGEPQPVARALPVEGMNREPQARPIDFKNLSLHWPLKSVQVTSPYGQRGREFHEGVDLRAHVGTPVYAAHSGQVLYAGTKIRGYGRMIVLKHSSGIATIYAHNSRLIVRRGQWVHQGTLIAYSGNTGHSHGPHLHFEIRSGVNAVNPLSVLPKPMVASRKGHMSGAARIIAQGDR